MGTLMTQSSGLNPMAFHSIIQSLRLSHQPHQRIGTSVEYILYIFYIYSNQMNENEWKFEWKIVIENYLLAFESPIWI